MSRQPPTDRQITLPAVPASLDPIHDLLASLWHDQPDIPIDARMRFETALMEIANNIIEHAGDQQWAHQTPFIDLSVTAAPGQLTASLTDTGPPATVDLPAVHMPDVYAEIGRGLALARALVDQVAYQRKDNTNEWTLTLDHSDASD